MGRDVPAIAITRRDRRAYREKAHICLEVLERMLRESRFDAGSRRVGLEIEFNLVDSAGRAAMTNADVLAAIDDPVWTSELGQFNIELDSDPASLAGDGFSLLESSLGATVAHAAERAEGTGSRILMVGILPSLRRSDIGVHTISANPRYKLLNDEMLAARGEEMRISIDGAEKLLAYTDHILPEAACTSVQCHFQVSPDSFACYWNAAQAIAGIQVAIGANSPYLFGRELWRETRITLFEQATDTRSEELRRQGVRPRVWFGERWITSVTDLFEENLRYFPALLPLCDDEDPVAVLDRGESPELAELTLHNGTVYRWNRPVYAVADGKPHLRVENRVLPAGPTLADVLANAALYYGLVRELAETDPPVWSRMPFDAAAANLVAGARNGLEAVVFWPGYGDVPVTELTLRHLLPLAASGLQRLGVSAADAGRMLSTIEQRCLVRQNGASWQVAFVRRIQDQGQADRGEALRIMTQDYIGLMNTKEPVHTWPIV
ncbi:MAG TPA: glutamate--cysteine ligase [Streptosporangiaceae bacterium]|nr:glutamate--cysteine ligase [Streptosporangiaceae bacterium]